MKSQYLSRGDTSRAIAVKNTEEIHDVNYILIDGKTLRQIILGNGKPIKELSLKDNRYFYLGADRAAEKWIPFWFEKPQYALFNGFLAANVIPNFDCNYVQELKSRSVRGYSYKYTGFAQLPDTIPRRLFGLVSITTPYTDYIIVSSTNSEITIEVLDSATSTSKTIWTSTTSLYGATFSINLYATSSYLYKNPSITPRLYADIILDYPNGQQRHEHVVYKSKDVDGNCPFLSKFFSERRGLTDCEISTTLSNLTSSQASTVNYFVHA